MLDCPLNERLAAFCDGLMDDEHSSLIAAHVEECTKCQDSLATLVDQPRDELLHSLRRKSDTPDPFAAEPMCDEVVDKVARISTTGDVDSVSINDSALQPDIPEFIGSYKVLKLLGQGGMGTVYQALHVGLDKVVAIKLLSERLAHNADAVSRFQREMKAVGKLQHPNIVAAYDAGEANGMHYLVMEFVSGIDLTELMCRHPYLSIPDVCELIRQAAHGLEHAARKNLVHRDIKPSNLMLTLDDDGKPLVKILDMGLALLADSLSSAPAGQQPGLTWSGQVMGTVDYMAPEQALDSHDVDVRADVYSLGATLWKLLTGETPFAHHKDASVARRLAALAYESVHSITIRRPDLPPDLTRLIDSMLSRERDHRPATPGEVAKRLTPFAAGSQLEKLLGASSSTPIESDECLRQTIIQTSPSGYSSPTEPTLVPGRETKGETSSEKTPPGLSRWFIGLCTSRKNSILVQNPMNHPRRGGGELLQRPSWIGVVGVFLLAAAAFFQIFYIQTRHGYVVVEIKDPQTKVTLGENAFTLDSNGKKFEITPGEHTLRIQNGELKFETDKFTLLNGKTEVFRVELLAGKIRVMQGDKEIGSERLPVPVSHAVAASSLTPREILTSPDWEWTTPENLGPAVNSGGHESYPRFSADGLRMWFLRDFFSRTDRAWVCERDARDKPWKPAKSVGVPFELAGPMADFFLSRDELTWLFATWDEMVTPRIVESTRTSRDAEWSAPRSLDAAGLPAQFPVLSADGLTLYLMKNYLDHRGDEICRMIRTAKTEPWSEPVNLGAPVNDVSDERPVWVSNDELILVFHSARGGRTNSRQFDLWLTTRSTITAPWEEPVSFGPTINSEWNEASACLSDDGRELVFESARPGGLGDADLYVSHRVPKRDQVTHPAAEVASGSGFPWPPDAPPPAIAPFDATQAGEHQNAWARHLGVSVEHTNSIGMKFVLVPPGEFTMGSTPAEIAAAPILVGEDPTWQICAKHEGPRHKVVISKPFYLAVYEVTQAEYTRLMDRNPSEFSPNGDLKQRVAGLDTSVFPVDSVNWHEASAFCHQLSLKEELTPFTLSSSAGGVPVAAGNGYRLPSEAEWEFACRAGTTTQFSSGNEIADLNAAGWSGANAQSRTHAAGELKANPFGLFDMHGNLWEWVLDRWDSNYYDQFAGQPAIDPWGSMKDETHRVVRGGFWATAEQRCSSSRRFFQSPHLHYGHNGFRVALSVDAVK